MRLPSAADTTATCEGERSTRWMASQYAAVSSGGIARPRSDAQRPPRRSILK